MDIREEALYYFRNLVYCLYREIRVFAPQNNPELHEKINKKSGFFDIKRGYLEADRLYFLIEQEQNITSILEPFFQVTWLTLDDLYKIFYYGDWLLSAKKYSYGGPLWAAAANTTLLLRQFIELSNETQMELMFPIILKLEHNTKDPITKEALICKKFKIRIQDR